MSPFLAICFVVALLLTLRALHDFGLYAGTCPNCGGRGEHREDCYWKEDE